MRLSKISLIDKFIMISRRRDFYDVRNAIENDRYRELCAAKTHSLTKSSKGIVQVWEVRLKVMPQISATNTEMIFLSKAYTLLDYFMEFKISSGKQDNIRQTFKKIYEPERGIGMI